MYRRSLYTLIKRNAPAPALATFDASAREAACLRRDRANIPLQALALMDDVQHVDAARVWADRLVASSDDDDARLAKTFRSATSRPPEEGEWHSLRAALERQRKHFIERPEAARAVLQVGETPASTKIFAAATEVAA